jgi:hypothetical protein
MYVKVFECTWMFFNVFIVYVNVFIVYLCIYNIFIVYFNVFIIFLNAFIICFNVFHCISMCLNVFINIVIGILPLHSHCNVFTMHTHLYIFFSLYTMTSFPTCYTTTLFFSISINPFQLSYNLWKNYISILTSCSYITPHYMFHVLTGCVKHSGAQVSMAYSQSTWFWVYDIYSKLV